MRYFLVLIIAVFFSACSLKKPDISRGGTIIFKTPNMKFYDKGFISKYRDHIHLEIYSAGQPVLNLKIYKDSICQNSFECVNSQEFNSKYLHSSYDNSFLYELFSQEKIYHRDKKNKILIKVK